MCRMLRRQDKLAELSALREGVVSLFGMLERVGLVHRDDDAEATTGELYGIYLDPSCWAKHLGRSLYLRSEIAMRALGYQTSRLWVLEANHRGRRFYEKAGYILDGHTKCIQREGAELREFRYQKKL